MSAAMRMAYLIFAHDNAAQLDALIAALLPPGSRDHVIVHADRNSALWQERAGRPHGDPRVDFIADPIAVRWGHWTQVAAIHRLIEGALARDCDYAHLISGADWPIASRAALAAELAATARPLCYIEAQPGVQEDRMQTFRLDARWLRLDPAQRPVAHAAAWKLRRLSHWLDGLRVRLHRPRSRPWGQWCKGSTWWSLPRDALSLLAEELAALLASGRLTGTVCADEHAVQTIVAAHFSDRIAGNRRFIDWSEGGSSPRLLRRVDRPALAASGAWFARKFDARVDDFFLAPGCFAPAVATAE